MSHTESTRRMDYGIFENAQRLEIELDLNKRWENGMEHHSLSKEFAKLTKSLDKINSRDLGIDFGGDGDNGETVMYILDIMFETQDALMREAMELMRMAILSDEQELPN